MSAYFDNLTYNLGMNYKGSCGYVALAMLISYYDTFLNDEIIPEHYDIPSVGSEINMIERRNSPGVLRDIIANPNNLSDTLYGNLLNAIDYYMHMEALSNVSLHAKLITIANAKGYYDFDDNRSPAGSFFSTRLEVLKTYLEETLGYIDGVNYSIEYNNTGNPNPSYSYFVRRFTIQKIKEGYPVLLSIGKNEPSSSGHVVIAYEYDENEDKIYTHMGYGSNRTHVTIESQGFNLYRTAFVIDFKSNHFHSNNYGVIKVLGGISTTNYYCCCSSSIHTHHLYNFNYISINNNEHKAICNCGEEKIETHKKYISGCSQKCHNCNWSIEYHYPSYKQYNSNYHYKTCSNCSLHQLEMHKFTYNPDTYRIYCSLCGYLTNDYINSLAYYIECILQKQIKNIV